MYDRHFLIPHTDLLQGLIFFVFVHLGRNWMSSLNVQRPLLSSRATFAVEYLPSNRGQPLQQRITTLAEVGRANG